MRKMMLALAIAGFLGSLSAVQASEGHDHDGGMDHGSMKHNDHGGMKNDDPDMSGHDDGHEHGHKDGHEHGKGSHDMSGMFMKKKQIDGYMVSFHVMKAEHGSSMGMGGTHHLMVLVEKNGMPVEGIVMNTKVVYPDGKSESKKAMKMNGQYMVGYDLQDGKKHQLMILFKTPDGKKHKGGIYYQ